MNTHLSRGRTFSAFLVLAVALLLTPLAGAVTIVVSTSVAGPVTVGQQFDVNLSISGWVATDGEVDGISFRVDFPTSLFSFVSDSPTSDGTEFLAESTQGAGYVFSDDTDETLVAFGRYLFGASDSADGTAGSVGGVDGGGILGSFRLQATAVGTGSIVASTNNVDDVFADENLNGILESNITGGITFGSASMEVIPEPSTSLLVALGAVMAMAGRRRRTA